MITGIAHVNLTVPEGSLDEAEAFYAGTLGFTRIEVPVLQRGTLAWFVFRFHLLETLHLFNSVPS
jgi:catechol 2,3-dioxygenase-like lactoylglutathione lyase family enzyme